MESEFTLKATDKQAQALFNSAIASVRLIDFMGDKKQYPNMDFNSSVVHKWRVVLRHREEVGEIRGTRSYASLMKLLTA